MDLPVLLFLVALVLAAVGAFVNPPRVSLIALAIAFIAAGQIALVMT